MDAKLFVQKYKPYALEAEAVSGINAKFILAQAALESGWGGKEFANNFFGIKANKSWKGEKVLITTTEILSSPNKLFPVIISVTPLGGGKYRYIVKDYFRAYPTAKDGFLDHVKFFFENPRYHAALKVKDDPNKFAEEVAKAGYATAPNYAKVLKDMIASVNKRWGS